MIEINTIVDFEIDTMVDFTTAHKTRYAFVFVKENVLCI